MTVKLTALGQQMACERCKRSFVAEVWVACLACQRNLKVRPEYIGHRVNCKGCAQTFRVTWADKRVLLVPASWKVSPSASGTARDDESNTTGQVQQAQTGRFQGESPEVDVSADEDVVGREFAADPEFDAVGAERARLKQEVEELRQQVKDVLAQNQSLSSLAATVENVQHERDLLREDALASKNNTGALELHAKDLERSLADANAAADSANVDFAKALMQERAQATAELQNLRAQSEQRSEEEAARLHAALARADQDRLHWQQQTDALRTKFECEQNLLNDEVGQLRDLTESLRKEKDEAIQRINALDSHQASVGESLGMGAALHQEEPALRAEIIDLREAIKTARKQEEATAAHLAMLREQLRARNIEEEDKRQRLVDLEAKLRVAEADAAEHKLQQTAARQRVEAECQQLKMEAQRAAEANALLQAEQSRLRSQYKQTDESRVELSKKVQDLQGKLDQQSDRASALQREMDLAKCTALAEQERVAILLAEAQTRAHKQKQEGENRLAEAIRRFDDERNALQKDLHKLEQQSGASRLERAELLARIAEVTQNTFRLTLDCDNLKVSCQSAEMRFQTQVSGLTQALQESQQHVERLRAELDQWNSREKRFQRDLATVQQERDGARQEAARITKQLESLQRGFDQERQSSTEELEHLRLQLNELVQQREALLRAGEELSPGQINTAVPGTGSASPNLLAPGDPVRFDELARKIEALEAELNQERASKAKSRGLSRGLTALGGTVRSLWSNPSIPDEDLQQGELGPESRLRALWTEVMSERERSIRQAAETLRTGLEMQLAELRLQLNEATERAERFESQLSGNDGPVVAHQ